MMTLERSPRVTKLRQLHVPYLSVVVDPATGVPWFRSMRAKGVHFDLNRPVDWCRVALYNLSSHATTTLDHDDFTYTFQTDGTTTFVTATAKAPYASLVLTMVVDTPDLDGDGVTLSVECTTGTTGLSLLNVEWPILLIPPPGRPDDFFISWGFAGGHNVTNALDDGVVSIQDSPGSMQYWAAVDGHTRAHLYFQTEDDDFNRKVVAMQGRGGAVEMTFRHAPDGCGLVANNGYEQPFPMRLECFRGRSRGQLAHYDDELRYRRWANDGDRPWMTRPNWKTASGFSQYAKDANVVAIHHGQSYDAAMAAETTKLRTFAAPTGKVIAWFYDWMNAASITDNAFLPPDVNVSKAISNVSNQGGLIKITSTAHGLVTNDQCTVQGTIGVPAAYSLPGTAWTITKLDNDNFTLNGSTFSGTYLGGGGFTKVPTVRAAVLSAWNTMKAGGVLPAPYIRFGDWNTSLTRKFPFAECFGLQPDELVLRKEDQTPWGFAGNGAGVAAEADWSKVGNVQLWEAVLAEQIMEMGGFASPNLPLGFYVDALPGMFGVGNFDVLSTTWTASDYYVGERDFFSQMRTLLRTIVPDAFLMTEMPLEYMIDRVEIMHLPAFESEIFYYPANRAFATVYGEHVKISSFENIVDGNSIAVVPMLVAVGTYMWHAGGMISYNTNVSHAPLIAGSAVDVSDPLYFFFNWIKKLEAARPRLANYIGARRMRTCLVDDIEEDALAAGGSTVLYFRAHAFDNPIHSSCWMNPNTGELGQVMTHHVPVLSAPAPGYEFSVNQTRKFRCVTADHPGLRPGLKRLYRDDGSGRVLIGEFRDSIEVDVTLTPDTIALLEVVPATLGLVSEL